jgi:hypothetical protein
MEEHSSPTRKPLFSRLGEDEWAIIVGLLLILLVVLGILGPVPW